MFRLALAVLALLATCVLAEAPAAPKYRARKVRVIEKGVLVANLLQVISDVSGLSIVLLDAPPTPKLDVKADGQPWDELLDDVVARAGLAMRREGSLVLVGTAARLNARVAGKYTGKKLKLRLQGADVRDGVELVSSNAGLQLGATAGTRPVTVALKNVAADQMVEVLLELAGAKAAPRRAVETGCAAAKSPLAKLKLVGTATGTALPMAIVNDEAGRGWVVALRGCLGVEKAEIKTVRPDELITLGTHDLPLGGAAIGHDSAKTETVAIEALLKELEVPGALAGTGRTGLLANKRMTLRFLRDVLGLKEIDEPLPRVELTRLATVPAGVGARVDSAILEGLHAKPEVLTQLVAEEFMIDGSRLLGLWLRLEVGDRAAALERVTVVLSELEENVASEQRLKSMFKDKPGELGSQVDLFDKTQPPTLVYLPTALAKLKTLGVSAKELGELEQRTKALSVHYSGK